MAMAQAKYKSEYRMSLVLGTAFPWGKGGELWADKVRERTQGRINIKLYPVPRWCRVTRRASSPHCARA